MVRGWRVFVGGQIGARCTTRSEAVAELNDVPLDAQAGGTIPTSIENVLEPIAGMESLTRVEAGTVLGDKLRQAAEVLDTGFNYWMMGEHPCPGPAWTENRPSGLSMARAGAPLP